MSRRRFTPRGARGQGAHSGYETMARGLGMLSIGLGLAEMIAPRAICRFLGMEGHERLVQAYGIRETLTGAAILASHDPTPWIWGRVGGDALDLATLATGFEGDNPRHGNLAVATAVVVGVTALDVVCAQGLTDEKRLAEIGDFDYADRSGFPDGTRAMRGAAADFEPPADFRIPEALKPWENGRPSAPPGMKRA